MKYHIDHTECVHMKVHLGRNRNSIICDECGITIDLTPHDYLSATHILFEAAEKENIDIPTDIRETISSIIWILDGNDIRRELTNEADRRSYAVKTVLNGLELSKVRGSMGKVPALNVAIAYITSIFC